MASISNTYDPTTTAQAMAQNFTSGRQAILTRQTTAAGATEKGLTTLGSALNSFQSSLLGMTGTNKAIAANSAVFSDTSLASATAGASATPGTYSFFVEQVATAQKLSYSGMTDFTGGGSLTMGAGANSFSVNLASKTTIRELAAAINGATGNTSISASVVSTSTGSELILTSKLTGFDNKITITPDAGVDGTLAGKLAAPTELVSPQDARVHVGSEGGTLITQPGNTLNVIDGVTMTLAKAQAMGTPPVTLTVAADPSKTATNAQAFVDAYNKLKSAIDGLVNPGDPKSGAAAGAFAGDSGVRALRDRLTSMLRGSGTTTLANFGILANREGTLSLDSARMNKALTANPTGLDTLIGSTAAGASSGLAGQLDTYLKQWTSSADGKIGARKEAVSKLQTGLTQRQALLDKQYDGAYARYLAQFTKLQSVQSNMSYNTSLFDALFSNSKD